MVKTFFFVISTTFLTLGAIIGAGFISGAELIAFFGVKGYLLPSVLFSVIFLIIIIALFITFKSKKYEIKNNALDSSQEKFGFRGAVSVVFTASMLAGLNDLSKELNIVVKFPLFPVIAMVLITIFSKRGIKGIERFNLIAMPIVILAVNLVIFSSKNISVDTSLDITFNKVKNCVLYAFMNVYICIPAMRDCVVAKNKKSLIISSFFSTAILLFEILLIISAIRFSGVNSGGGLPIFLVAESGIKRKVIILSILVCTLTSAFISYYPAYKTASKKSGKFGALMLAILTLSISFIGLDNIVKFIYPIIGGAGLVSAVKILLGIKNFDYADNKGMIKVDKYGG